MMTTVKRWIVFSLLSLQSNVCFSADSYNIVLLPDSFNSFKCHHPGIEFKIADKYSVGVLGSFDCKSKRSTYGSINDAVKNTFNRILVPIRYSKDGAFKDGAFMQALIGIEKSKFRSELGSRSDVTFVDLAFHYGYQWYWNNGFNISILGGIAVLVKTNSSEDIVLNEQTDIINFLDKNTKTNVHPGAGLIFGWKF